MNYKDYLQTDHWKNFRQRVYSQKKNRACRICQRSERLNIHHKMYKDKHGSILFRETLAQIIVLCQECHYAWHKYRKEKLKWKYADRIRFLMKSGQTREYAFTHCKGVRYKRSKKRLSGVLTDVNQPDIIHL